MNGLAPAGPPIAPAAVVAVAEAAGAPKVNPAPLDAGAPAPLPNVNPPPPPPLTEPVVDAVESVCPIALDVGLPKPKPPAVVGAGEVAGAAPNANDGALDAAGAVEPNANGEGAPVAGAPKVNEGVAAPEAGAGEGGAGEGDADGAPPKLNVAAAGLVGLVAPAPKNEFVAGAPKGEAGGFASFFSAGAAGEVEAPNVKPGDSAPVPNPAAGAAALEVAPKEKAGAGVVVLGSASSSMPLSPASSVTEAGADGGFSVPAVPNSGFGDSFFSSACGVAGVVPNVNVGVAGFAAAPKENGVGLSFSSDGFAVVLAAPKANGAGAESDLVAPNANGDAEAYNGEIVSLVWTTAAL